MTNFITSVGVQQFSISFSAAQATNTATITSVGTGAFIVYGGFTTDGSGDPQRQFCYVTKTNATTITATRGVATGTCIITGCIIDGDTTNLIKSVQYGTINKLSGSLTGTASISAVTSANTVVHCLGISVADTSANHEQLICALSLSGTTVTATVGVTGQTATISFVIIEFQSTCLTATAVQRISASTSSNVATSWTASLTSITATNALSFWGGANTTGVGDTGAKDWMKGVLTNGTTFTASVNTAETSTKNYNASVVEFNAGVLNSSSQRGTTTLTAATSNTSTITGVTLGNSMVSFLGNTSTDTGFGAPQEFAKVVFTNGTTITTSINTSGTVTSSWDVGEFPAFSAGTFNPGWTYGATRTIGGVF